MEKICKERVCMQNYNLGLTINREAVGWSVIDDDHKVIKRKGSYLWGVRLYDPADDAAEWSARRRSRRRIARLKYRVSLLQDIFADEIQKVDPVFFQRMNESFFDAEDKRTEDGAALGTKYSIFDDENYKDNDYYKQFPTVYHLRKYLMQTEETPDIRLVYLALLHIIKNRGHFNFSGSFSQIKEFEYSFNTYLLAIAEAELDFHLSFTDESKEAIAALLKDSKKTKKFKKTELLKYAQAKTKCEKGILSLITGATVKLSDIFSDPSLDEAEMSKISFAGSWDDDIAGLYETVLSERYHVIESAKAIYDWSILTDIMQGYSFLSEGKVDTYDKHKHDLRCLKRFIKSELGAEVYKMVFLHNSKKVPNYVSYVGYLKTRGASISVEGSRSVSKDDFYKFIKDTVISAVDIKTIKHEENKKIYEYISEELESRTFLPRLSGSENLTIPNQAHLAELDEIIKNLSSRIPLLEDEQDKLRQLATFRVPFYVGRLTGAQGNKTLSDAKRLTAVRFNNDKIYPWNFAEEVDLQACRENFIQNLVRPCSYLENEPVLPKCSLLYSRYCVLNALNKIKIDGVPISVELKQKIYREVFQKYKKVTLARLKTFLVKEGVATKHSIISGTDGDFANSLTAYIDFSTKFAEYHLDEESIEKIIFAVTVFGQSKELLRDKIKSQFPQLPDDAIKKMSQLQYREWGVFSRKFLEELKPAGSETEGAWSIIDAMWWTNDNLEQLLHNRSDYREAVMRYNGTREEITNYTEIVEKLPVPIGAKRQLWQLVLIVREVQKLMGGSPKEVFITVEKDTIAKTKEIRKKSLINLYIKHKELASKLQEIQSMPASEFRKKKTYLYYLQKGRCMYSGEEITLADLMDDSKCDIDHIYPRSKVMDDRIDNLVLVKRDINAEKKNKYPVALPIRSQMQPFWLELFEQGFISKTKYERLISSEPISMEELAAHISGFFEVKGIIPKNTIRLLEKLLPSSEIVPINTKIISQFRNDFSLVWVRDMNNLHYAKEAYLNAVVGKVYYTKFTKYPYLYMLGNTGFRYNLRKLFVSEDTADPDGCVVWRSGEDGSIKMVERMWENNNIAVSFRINSTSGELFGDTLQKKREGLFPHKSSDERLCQTEKYGGYTKITSGYYAIVESKNAKGALKRTIECIPLYLVPKAEKDPDAVLRYLSSQTDIFDPKILVSGIRQNTLFIMNGSKFWLRGRTGAYLAIRPANQLLLPDEYVRILKRTLGFVDRLKDNPDLLLRPAYDGICDSDLVMLYDKLIEKSKTAVYAQQLSFYTGILIENRGTFEALTAEEKCRLIAELLHLFQCNSVHSDLTLIGGSKHSGVPRINKDITDIKNICMVNQSVTGVIQNIIDVNKEFGEMK